MRFKKWLEIVEPTKPLGRVRKSNIVKDKGTNVAKPAIQYSWTTKLGNKVKLHFTQERPDEYEVVFYVNDTLYDDASANTANGRDPEILAGIFYLLKVRADQLRANRLTFRAYESEGDTKTIRGLDPTQSKQQAFSELQKFSAAVQQYQPRLVPPSETKIALWKKLGRGEPQPLYDFQKELWLKWIPRLSAALQNNQRMYDFINELKTAEGTDKFRGIYDVSRLIAALTSFDNAVASNSEAGWQRKRNRRGAIYSRLVNRIMADEWDIQQSGDRFDLTRKMALGESGDVAYRYVHNDGRGLMNNGSLNYDKLDDDEYAEVEEEYLGLQQPPHNIHNQRVLFVFTSEGEQRHQRLIELLSKASKTGVRRESVPLSNYQVVWQSSDGQLGLV